MKHLVSKYINLWKAFFKNSLSRDMEFKMNFILELFIDAIFYISLFFFFKIILQFQNSFGDFNEEAIIIFLILVYLIDSIYIFFLGGNVFEVNNQVKSGDLDFTVIKPVNPQFFISFRYVNSYAIISIVILTILLIKLTYQYHDNQFLIMKYFLLDISIFLGIIIFYSIEFIIACLVFWFRNFSYAGWLAGELTKYSRRPDSIYYDWFRKILFSFLPMALIASVPARMLLFDFDPRLLLIQFCVAALFFTLSVLIWRKGLMRYESASS